MHSVWVWVCVCVCVWQNSHWNGSVRVIRSILTGQDTDSNNPRITERALIPFIHLTTPTPGNPSNPPLLHLPADPQCLGPLGWILKEVDRTTVAAPVGGVLLMATSTACDGESGSVSVCPVQVSSDVGCHCGAGAHLHVKTLCWSHDNYPHQVTLL